MKWKFGIAGILLFITTFSGRQSLETGLIFSAESNDSWNRIFTALFTRTVRTRLTDDFPDAAPFSAIKAMGSGELRVSDRVFERLENGDRAIEPLYPSYLTSVGPLEVLHDQAYSELTAALTTALEEPENRSPLARALMQADVWAAHDILSRDYRFGDPLLRERRDALLSLLTQFVKKIALSSEEIRILPSNYAAAVAAQGLPDFFDATTEWIEVRWFDERLHDSAADFRRAARIFLKPAAQPQDQSAFVDELRRTPAIDKLDAVALVIQNLLIDSHGAVVPSPIIYQVQLRTFLKGEKGKFLKTELSQHELSRRLLLTNPNSGGLVASNEFASAYLPDAGNDFSFASLVHTRSEGATASIASSLRRRCVACHSRDVRTLFTFTIHGVDPVPPARAVDVPDNEHARYVAERKAERQDFKALGSFK
jgi:hypothetical protein